MDGAREFIVFVAIFSGATRAVPGVDERAPIWVKSFRGTGHTTAGAAAAAVDPTGGVIVVGNSGTDENLGLLVVKYDADGDVAWTVSHDSPGNARDAAVAILLDHEGNSIIAGAAEVSNEEGSIILIKLSPSGEERWKVLQPAPDGFFAVVTALAVTPTDLAVVVGYYTSGGGDLQAFAAAFDATGALVWQHTETSAQLNAVIVHPDGHIYVTGQQVGPVGPGVDQPWDFLTIKLATDGTVAWKRHFDDSNHRTNRATALAAAPDGVVVAGASMWASFHLDYLVIAYAADGTPGRPIPFDASGNNDEARFVAVDREGNYIVSGNTSTQSTSFDLTTIKFSPGGRRLWIQRYDSPVKSEDSARGLAMDLTGNVYLTARSMIDPETRAEEFITFLFSDDGRELWRSRHAGPAPGRNRPLDIVLDGKGNAYVVGESPAGSGLEMTTIKIGPLSYLRGDCDGDGSAGSSVSDAVFLLRYLFLNGDVPPCLAACNFDGGERGSLTISDAAYLLRHGFLGGDPPPPPFPDCGPGTAGDERLGCARGCGQAR